jgi:hypothetical protein
LVPVLVVLSDTAACRWSPPAPDGRLAVEIESADLRQLESFPDHLVLHVEGWLPYPCATLAWDLAANGPTESEIAVDLYAVPNGRQACIQVMAPFPADIPLGTAPKGSRVILNGQVIGT